MSQCSKTINSYNCTPHQTWVGVMKLSFEGSSSNSMQHTLVTEHQMLSQLRKWNSSSPIQMGL